MHARSAIALTFAAALLVGGCGMARNAYYSAWEKLGYAKRERLVDYVKAARDEQKQAKEQFTSALDQFKGLTGFQGGELEKTYNRLNDQYETCQSQAEEVRNRITSVKNVATALFNEWEGEIGQMSDASLKSQSQDLLKQTRSNYDQMITRMDKAAESMNPVLQSFKDRVLILKHELNAQAIASLSEKEVELNRDIEKLVKEMEASIAEADRFLNQLQG